MPVAHKYYTDLDIRQYDKTLASRESEGKFEFW